MGGAAGSGGCAALVAAQAPAPPGRYPPMADIRRCPALCRALLSAGSGFPRIPGHGYLLRAVPVLVSLALPVSPVLRGAVGAGRRHRAGIVLAGGAPPKTDVGRLLTGAGGCFGRAVAE